MQQKIDDILRRALAAVMQSDSEELLQHIKVEYLGKKGELTELLKSLGALSVQERPVIGGWVNQAKQALQMKLEEKEQLLKQASLQKQLAAEKIDVTLSGRHQSQGQLHPITQVQYRIESIFTQMGFDIVTGPEIEDDYHNFEALNIPRNHPARDMQDTFYFPNGLLLRTHTSPVQIRTMLKEKAPLRIIAPGRVYRCDFDVTHTPMFHQLEGLMVGEGISFAHLKGLMIAFFQAFFNCDINMRFRASYFPFTEPSAEADMQCVQCHGKGCRVCSHTGWLEVGGCGMVHPNVLKAVGIDDQQYSGFAFGCGIDRLAMLYYGVPDLRLFFENDQRFLSQF